MTISIRKGATNMTRYITDPQASLRYIFARIIFKPNQGPKETRRFLKQLKERWPNVHCGVHMPPKYDTTWSGGAWGQGQRIYSGPNYPLCRIKFWQYESNDYAFSDLNEFINDVADVLNREGINEVEVENHTRTTYKF